VEKGGGAEEPPPRAETPPKVMLTSRSQASTVAEKEDRYAKMSAAQLETALRRLLTTARIPPSTAKQTMESYSTAMAAMPKAQREQSRRRYLLQLVRVYTRPSLRLKPLERKSLPELVKIFMGMKTKANLSVQQKRSILDSTLSSFDKSQYSPGDRDFYKRLSLAAVITNMSPRTR
jgi:hypothetical protein